MITLDEPAFFVLLITIPVVIYFWLNYKKWRHKVYKLLGDHALVQHLLLNYSFLKEAKALLLVLIAIGFLSFAASGPFITQKQQTSDKARHDIIFVLDVSLSMLAEDVAPNRLEKAARIAYKVIEKLDNASVGIVVFSGIAYPLVPLTPDRTSALNSFSSIKADMLPVPGSSLDAAINMALRYSDGNTKSFIFILSDGENHANELDKAVLAAVSESHKIFTLGVATNQQSFIPVNDNKGDAAYKRDLNGTAVLTSLQEHTLKKISDETGGSYRQVTSTSEGVEYITSIINNQVLLDTQKSYSLKKIPLFQWLVGATILLLAIELLYDAITFTKTT